LHEIRVLNSFAASLVRAAPQHAPLSLKPFECDSKVGVKTNNMQNQCTEIKIGHLKTPQSVD